MAGQASDVAARDARDELRLNAATGLVFDALAGRSRTSAHKPDSRSMRVYRCHHSSTYRLVLTLVAVVHMSLVLLEPPSGSRTVPVAPGQPPLQYTSTTALEAAVLLCYALDIALQARYAGVRTYLSARWNVVEVLVTLVFLADVLSTATGLVKVQFSRALRPIFVITKRRHVRFLVTGIAQAVPALAPLLLLAVASMAVFSFVGVLLLSGSSGLFPDLASDPSAFPPGCTPFVPPHEPAPGNLSVLPGGIVPPRDVACEDYFSSIGLALYTMFNLFNKTAWPNAMIPFLERHPVSALFFVVFMLVGHFLLFRLLVAVAFASFSESANVRLRRQATHSRAAVLRAYRLLADLDTGFVSLQAFRALAARVRPSVPSEVYDIVFRAVGGDCGLLGPNAFVAACRLLDVRARPVPGARRAGSALMRIFRAAAGSDEADDEGNDGGGGDGGGPRKGPRRRAWEQSGGWGGGEDEDDEDDEDDLLGHELTREAGDDNDDLTVAPSLVAAAVSGPNRLDVGGPRHSVSPGGAARASRRGAGSPGRVPSFRLRRPSASGAGGRCCGRGRQARLTSTRRHGCLGALRDASDDARRPVRRLLRSAVGETATVLLVLVAATVEVVLQAATATVTRAPAGTAGEVAAALQRASESFSLVFAAEMALKLWAYGPWSYARRVVDAADGLIAVSGVAVLVARAAGAAEGCVAAPWSSAEAACERARLALVLVQALRVLRVLRLLRPFWQPVLALRRTAPLLLRIAVVLAIASYSLSAVGMELYAGALSPFHARAHHVLLSSYGKAGFWSINYATFPGALLASLWLALNTKAPMLYEGVMASEDSWAPLAFFVVAYGALVLAFLPVAQAFVIRGFQSHLSMIARRDAGMVEAWEHLTASAQARMFAERPAVFGAPQRWVLSLPERFSRVGEVMFGASLRVEFEGHASLRPVAEAVDAVSRAEDAATEASDAAKRAEAAGTPAPPGALGPPDVRSAAELLVHLSVDKERAVSLAASMQKRLGIRTRTMAPAEAAAAAAAEAAAGTSGAGEDGDAAGSGGEAAATAAGAAGRGEAVPSGPGAGLHSRRETAPRVVGMPSASERGGAALATPVGGLGPRGRAGGGFAFGGDDGSSDGGPSAAAALVGAGSDGSDDGRSSAGGAASAPPGLGKTAVTPARGSLPSSERRFRAAATPAHPVSKEEEARAFADSERRRRRQRLSAIVGGVAAVALPRGTASLFRERRPPPEWARASRSVLAHVRSPVLSPGAAARLEGQLVAVGGGAGHSGAGRRGGGGGREEAGEDGEEGEGTDCGDAADAAATCCLALCCSGGGGGAAAGVAAVPPAAERLLAPHRPRAGPGGEDHHSDGEDHHSDGEDRPGGRAAVPGSAGGGKHRSQDHASGRRGGGRAGCRARCGRRWRARAARAFCEPLRLRGALTVRTASRDLNGAVVAAMAAVVSGRAVADAQSAAQRVLAAIPDATETSFPPSASPWLEPAGETRLAAAMAAATGGTPAHGGKAAGPDGAHGSRAVATATRACENGCFVPCFDAVWSALAACLLPAGRAVCSICISGDRATSLADSLSPGEMMHIPGMGAARWRGLARFLRVAGAAGCGGAPLPQPAVPR